VLDYALFGNSSITTLTVSKGVCGIGKYAFAECRGITKIIFDAESCAALSEGTNAFANSCDNAAVTVGENARSVPAYLFASTDSLTSPKIESVSFDGAVNCAAISGCAFKNLVSLRSLTLSQSVKMIENNAFLGSGLSEIGGSSGVWTNGEINYNYNSQEFIKALTTSSKSFERMGG